MFRVNMSSRLHILAIYLMFVCLDLALFLRFKTKKQKHIKSNEVIRNSKGHVDPVKPPVYGHLYDRLYFEHDIFKVSDKEIQQTKNSYTILLFNVPEYMSNFAKKDILYTNCEYKNCILSRNFSKLFTADAVLFYIGIRNERMGNDPPIQSKHRNPNQVWIYTSVEPPEHYYNTDYRSTTWQHTMNWSSLYRLDSDIPNPYGCLIRQNITYRRDYVNVYNSKTRNALWVVSHCHVASERRLYVRNMIKNGFDVDILGGCGPDGKKIGIKELEQIIPMYKYFLAFENSLCQDYISEKFFQNYNYTWIIIVRGGADYRRLLPDSTYINTADFSGISSLVQYLSFLGNDKEKYTEFLRNKDRYISIRWPGNRNCEICRRLNNRSKFRKEYKNLEDYLTNSQCERPKDL